MDPADDDRVGMINMDGSIWADWPRMEIMAARPLEDAHPGNTFGTIFVRLILAARGTLTEVSRERSEEIALEYGAKLLG